MITTTPRPAPAPRPNTFTLTAAEVASFQNSFQAAYNNFYQFSVIRILVETRTWQWGQTIPPLSSYTFQFWLEREYLNYRWRALFLARGGFQLSVFGIPVGPSHKSLGDLSYFRDLEFFVFGSYEFPVKAGLILTSTERLDQDYVGIRVPETSQGDQVVTSFGKIPSHGG